MRFRRPRRKKSFFKTLVIVAVVVLGSRYLPLDGYAVSTPQADLQRLFGQPDPSPFTDPHLTAARLRHITTGDATGGGHLYGVRKPCKSEFPADWTTDKIARDIPVLAANDNLQWNPSRNGYVTTEVHSADGLRIRIVVDPSDNEIVTAYPVNVRRNPCPAANDNFTP